VLSQFKNRNNSCLCAIGDRNRITQMIAVSVSQQNMRYIVEHSGAFLRKARIASRGDQILNAKSFAKQGFSYVIEEEKLTDQTLLDAVREVYADREKYIHTMSESGQMDSIGTILKLIESVSK
jgi:hypothetical protein